jgi:MFS family permease
MHRSKTDPDKAHGIGGWRHRISGQLSVGTSAPVRRRHNCSKNPHSVSGQAPMCSYVIRAHGQASIRPTKLSPAAAFYLVASMTVSFLAGSAAPTSLYPLYQTEWGFSPVTVTVVFGIYALALLSALLVAGRLSDHSGRRPVLIVAALAQAATMLVFATAGGLALLLVARVLQGVWTGVAVAAVGAALLDLDKTRGAVANAAAPPLGTAIGGIVGGLMVHYLPAPKQLVYLLLAGIFVLQGIGVAFMAESVSRRPGALASLRPQLRLPGAVRGPLLLAVPALIAAWALAGFYASLGPALIRNMFGLDSSLLGGLALAVLAGSGGVSVLLLGGYEPRTMMSFGALALLVGVAIAALASSSHSATTFFLATAVGGMGFGSSFQGAVRTVVPLAAAEERAGVLSVIFVVSYLAMGVPAVIAGYVVTHGGDIPGTMRQFAVVVMVLAGLALLGTLKRSTA